MTLWLVSTIEERGRGEGIEFGIFRRSSLFHENPTSYVIYWVEERKKKGVSSIKRATISFFLGEVECLRIMPNAPPPPARCINRQSYPLDY